MQHSITVQSYCILLEGLTNFVLSWIRIVALFASCTGNTQSMPFILECDLSTFSLEINIENCTDEFIWQERCTNKTNPRIELWRSISESTLVTCNWRNLKLHTLAFFLLELTRSQCSKRGKYLLGESKKRETTLILVTQVVWFWGEVSGVLVCVNTEIK